MSGAPEAKETARTPTAERILEAAETLFARQGTRGISLKEITEWGGVNIAANCQFRSEDALLRAVDEPGFPPMNQERFRLLEEAGRPSTPCG